MAPANSRWNFNYYADAAVTSGDKQLLDYVLSGGLNYEWNFNEMAGTALKNGDKKYVR